MQNILQEVFNPKEFWERPVNSIETGITLPKDQYLVKANCHQNYKIFIICPSPTYRV